MSRGLTPGLTPEGFRPPPGATPGPTPGPTPETSAHAGGKFGAPPSSMKKTVKMGAELTVTMGSLRDKMIATVTPPIQKLLIDPPYALPIADTRVDYRNLVNKFVAASVDAFLSQDLYTATRQLLGSAKGSFGLVTSHSLDASQELVVAARGQTMSVALYPQLGIALFGSEAAATKVGMGMAIDGNLLGEAEVAEVAERGGVAAAGSVPKPRLSIVKRKSTSSVVSATANAGQAVGGLSSSLKQSVRKMSLGGSLNDLDGGASGSDAPPSISTPRAATIRAAAAAVASPSPPSLGRKATPMLWPCRSCEKAWLLARRRL